MRNKIMNLTIICLFINLIVIIFLNNKIVATNIISGINLWTVKVFPSLFPMFVISDILINYGFVEIISKILAPITKRLFNVNGNGSYVFVMSLISGCPSSAYITKELLSQSKLSCSDATKVLCFSFFANPLFLYNMLSLIFSTTLVIKIITIHYLSNIIIGIIFRNYKQKENVLDEIIVTKKTTNEFGTILGNSISKAINTLLLILATIIFYIVISTSIVEVVSLNSFQNSVLKGALEITQGLNSLVELDISITLKCIAAISFISFGGFSIHTQIKSILSDTNISYKTFFKARILHVIVSVILLLIILIF